MRLSIGIVAGILSAWATAAIYRPTIRWAFTRIPPATPETWTPRYRTWHHGQVTEGAWE